MHAHLLAEGGFIDGFRIGKKLHAGGMASLWDVTREDANGPLLMKVPTIDDMDDPTAIVGFEMEQMILPLLKGIHVPKVFALGEFATQPYIVMERITGGSLLPKLDAAPLPIVEVVALGIKVADALDDIHRQHVLHFDVKPSNVMLRETGEAVLIDFGLARHERLPDLLAEEFRVPLGTAPYISPEQVRRNRTDPRSDLFSLGVILYHFITRQRPFGYPRSQAALRRRLWRDPLPPRAINLACPRWLQEIVLRCLEPDPALRYPTAAQVAFDLKNPDEVRLTQRADRLKQDAWFTAAKRWYATKLAAGGATQSIARQVMRAPIIVAAVDLTEDFEDSAELLRNTVERVLAVSPGVRLACVNVLKTSRLSVNYPLDDEGRNIHVLRLVALKEWARPLELGTAQVTFHVLEAPDPAAALVDYALVNRVDQMIIAAKTRFGGGGHLGSVAMRVVVESPCTVTVVR
ncbi:MAG: serine/threonine protein kinase [Beijerinckiaceae bacterium]